MDTYYKEPSANQNLLNSCIWGSKWWQIPAYCLAVHSLATRAGGRSFARRKRHQQIMQHKTRWKKRKEKWRVFSVALGIKRGHWIEYFIDSEGWGSLYSNVSSFATTSMKPSQISAHVTNHILLCAITAILKHL